MFFCRIIDRRGLAEKEFGVSNLAKKHDSLILHVEQMRGHTDNILDLLMGNYTRENRESSKEGLRARMVMSTVITAEDDEMLVLDVHEYFEDRLRPYCNSFYISCTFAYRSSLYSPHLLACSSPTSLASYTTHPLFLLPPHCYCWLASGLAISFAFSSYQTPPYMCYMEWLVWD